MFRSLRHMTLIGLLGAGVGVPYFASTGHGLQSVRDWWNKPSSADPSRSTAFDPALDAAQNDVQATVPVTLPGEEPAIAECAPPQNLAEVFRFDISIEWIVRHWPNVSAVPGGEQGQGYRVPLVTGVREDDVAGSLTYYFGTDRRIQKITFDGTSGNPDRLIAVVATPQGLTRRSTSDAGLFLYQRTWNGQATSELRVRPATVMSASAPHRRFLISLVLTRPASSWF